MNQEEYASGTVIELLPHRSPFLFVDHIIKEEEKVIVTERKLRPQEDFFKGHFPNLPVMPGVLLLENIFQSGALMITSKLPIEERKKKIGVVARIDKTKFKRPCRPHDVLITEVELLEQIDFRYSFKGTIKVNDAVMVTTHFDCSIIDRSVLYSD